MENTTELNTQELAASLSLEQLQELMELKKHPEKVAQRKREKEYVKKRDAFIRMMIGQAVEVSVLLKELKSEVVVRGNELHDLLYEVYEREPKELNKFSLITEDGLLKVEIDRAPIMGLNETAQVHIDAIQQVFTDKFKRTNKKYWQAMETLLMRNDSGDYDPKMCVKLRKYSDVIEDPRFDSALDGLAKASYQTGTATYARFYKKNLETNSWVMIPMQFSSI